MKESNVKRNSSIELLRIIVMFSIVIYHFGTHGNLSFGRYEVTLPRFWWYFLEMLGDIADNIFIIISGYFLTASADIQSLSTYLKKLVKFVSQVIFYSVSIYLLFVAFGLCEFSLPELVSNLLPIAFDKAWFATAYFILYIIHPFINKLIHSLDKITYQKMLLILLTLWCIVPTFTTLTYGLDSLIWFIILYLVAGYYRLYGLNTKIDKKTSLVIFLLTSVLRYLSAIVLMLLGMKISFFSIRTLYFTPMNSILTFIASVMLFVYFEKTELKYNKFINTISSATFGIYLIHDNDYLRSFLWTDLLNIKQFQSSLMLIPYSIVCALVIYVLCTLIDLFRQKLIEKHYIKLINPCIDRASNFFIKTYTKLIEIIF